MNLKQNPEILLVCRDGEPDDEYYNAVYAAKRRAATVQLGQEALQVVTTPIRNFSLNMLDLLREGKLTS